MTDDNKKQKIINKLLNFFINYIIIIIFAAGGALFILACFIFLIPKYKNTQNSIIAEEEKINKELSQSGSYLSKLISEKEWLDGVDRYDLAKLDEILPQKQSISGIISKISFLAEENNFILEDIKYAQEKNAKLEGDLPADIKILKINVTLGNGEYANFKNFLNMAARDVNIMDIISVSLKGKGYDMEIMTYYK
ncbi:MAG: type 4a pilus biogenesis protein PilO [bacterium]